MQDNLAINHEQKLNDLLQFFQHHHKEISQLWKYQHSEVAEFVTTLILSVSDGCKRAKTITLQVDEKVLLHTDWRFMVSLLKAKLIDAQEKFNYPLKWCRLEWAFDIKKINWQKLPAELKQYKRNYFRSGLAFNGKREPKLLLTEMELNANACLYQGQACSHAIINEKNFIKYFKKRHGSSQIPKFKNNLPVWLFKTCGIFIDADELKVNPNKYHILSMKPRHWGHRRVLPLDGDSIDPFIAKSTYYLSSLVTDTGRYIYGYFPCFDRKIDNYNSLRHASSTYALIEGYEAGVKYNFFTKEQAQFIRDKVNKAINYLNDELIDNYNKDTLAYVIDQNQEIKLGANAVAILAMCKYAQVFDDHKFITIVQKLANGIIKMQKPNGQFIHVLDANDLAIKEESRIIYYDGEAAFALMRLYAHTKEKKVLNCVVKAFDYFIQAGHYDANDHWLSYCVNELVKYKPERKYFQFGVDNIKDYLDFIKNRLTTFPTLLELAMAFHNMLLTLSQYPQYYDVIDNLDLDKFYKALNARANYLLNGFFYPEMAMFFKAPNHILNGFFIRHHAFRVRIDDVEHYISGLVAYKELLNNDRNDEKKVKQTYQIYFKAKKNSLEVNKNINELHHHSKKPILNAKDVAKVTKGRWIVPPKEATWHATGVCIWAPSFKQGQLLVTRNNEEVKGYLSKQSISKLLSQKPSGILTENPLNLVINNTPILQVDDVKKATIALGAWTRSHFKGQVIGITGSAGKTTTVAMWNQALKGLYKSDSTKFSANLPVGIAWNLASMDQAADFWIAEMAIGQMDVNSQLVKPDVAVITNIGPAHLTYHQDLTGIARKKGRIFDGMSAGSLAIIYRDMPEFALLADLAISKGLSVLSYGVNELAYARLINENKQYRIKVEEQLFDIDLSVIGEHFLLNSLAIVAWAAYKKLDIEYIISNLKTFIPISGRGNVSQKTYKDISITIYDDAYNANPLSMHKSINGFNELDIPALNKVLVLGDMLELGEKTEYYHQELAEQLKTIEVKRILLVGEHVQTTYHKLKELTKNVEYFRELNEFKNNFHSFIEQNDHILIKSSNKIGLHRLFSQL